MAGTGHKGLPKAGNVFRARWRAAGLSVDAAAGAADAAITGIWRQLLTMLRDERDPWAARARAARVLQGLRPALRTDTGAALLRSGRAGHAAGLRWARGLPVAYLRAAALRRRVVLREDEGQAPALSWDYLLDALGIGSTRQDLEAYLFPPPSEAEIFRLLDRGPDPWHVQLERATRLAPPDVLAQIIGSDYALGKSQREIARDLMPALNNVRVSARRIARTVGVQIGHELQMRAHEALGDLIAGYTIHSAHVPDSRHWHVLRDGTTYYREPGPGQLGYDRMPRPPAESPDPRDRPPKAPAVAPNCLCHLTPVLRPL